MADLNRKIGASQEPYKIIEVDLVSCHMKILADLDLGTPQLSRLMTSGGNIWQEIIGTLSKEIVDEFGFKYLKAASKRLGYKCLQGGRINTPDRIKKTLESDARQLNKDLNNLAIEFHKNSLLQKVDKLNVEIMERYERLKFVNVFTPMDERPYRLNKPEFEHAGNVRHADMGATTYNPCRLASQVVTGVEMLQLVTIIEGIRKLALNWIPISLDHDGCALLVHEEGLDSSQKLLEEYVKERLQPAGVIPAGLEFSEYESPSSLEGAVEPPFYSIKDNRLI